MAFLSGVQDWDYNYFDKGIVSSMNCKVKEIACTQGTLLKGLNRYLDQCTAS